MHLLIRLKESRYPFPMTIFDKSSFWYGSYYQGRDIKKAADNILRLSNANPTEKLVELGCGEIAARGFEIVGLDPSIKMIEIARNQNPNIRFVKGDINDVRRGNFNILFGYFHVMNYAVAGGKLEEFLKRVRDSLTGTSRAIFDFWNYDVVSKAGLSAVSRDFIAGEKLLTRRVFPKIENYEVELKIQIEEKESGHVVSNELHRLGLFEISELRVIAERIGLNIEISNWVPQDSNQFTSVAILTHDGI